ncbi:MAG: hypothetical protein Q4P66_03500 [Actinomycetaceae bacterium]|nr:hypothetical protein [Actinomycetaceae bacterium]
MATLAAASLALTGLVAAGIGAWANLVAGMTGIIPNPDNPSGVTSKMYWGHGAENPEGTICGFIFVEKGDYNTRSGWYKNNSGAFFHLAFGDEALKGVVVHGMVTTKDGEVIPRQHGPKVEALTAVTDDQGRYCFDCRPYGMEELGRGLGLYDFVKVWPEHLLAYDAYPQGLVPHYFNGGGRTTQVLTQTLSFLAPAAITSDARAGVGTKNPYTGGANISGGYIDGGLQCGTV